jgi:hypothetical protein
LAKFDAALSQVIYSTYLWTGTVSGIALDGAGDVYLVGSDYTGVNGVVMKVSAADSSVLYSTALSGVVPNAIAMDASGNALIVGTATGLAVTKGAYESIIPGPCARTIDVTDAFLNQENTHAFVAKLNGSGALVNATYITGSCGDSAYAVALDASGAVYVAGETYSSDFPVTADAMIATFPSTYSSAFVAKLSPAGDQLLYASFVGGGSFSAAHALALDGAGNVYLAGSTQASPTAGAAHASSGGGCPQRGPTIGPPQIPPPICGWHVPWRSRLRGIRCGRKHLAGGIECIVGFPHDRATRRSRPDPSPGARFLWLRYGFSCRAEPGGLRRSLGYSHRFLRFRDSGFDRRILCWRPGGPECVRLG